jgi:hypothetical protein
MFPAVTSLDLRHCKHASPALVQAVIQAVPSVDVIHLRVGLHCSVNKRRYVSNIRRLMKAVRDISAAPCQRRCTFLLDFEVLDGPFWWNENLSDSNLKRMFDCTPPNLQVQKMDFTMHVCQNMSRSSFELLGTMTGLKELTLMNSSTVSNAGFAQLSNLTNLEHLYVGAGMPVTDATLTNTLAPLQRLRSLTLLELRRVTDAGIAAMAELHLPVLKRIGLHGFSSITDEALALLRGLTSLRVVAPRECPQISDVGLSYLADMPSLCVADVRGCFRVTVAGAAALRNRTGRRVWVLLGDSDAAAAAQAAAADALGAAAVDAPEYGGGGDRGLSLAAAAGSLVVGSGDGSSGSRGCPLYAKYYDKLYPHSAQGPQAGRAAQAV